MPQAVDNISLALEQIHEQLRNLEQRVASLEGQSESRVPVEPQLATLKLERPRPPATWRGFPPVEAPSGSIPVFGKAVLGIAGAYLLRALAESPSIPKLPLLFVAILYACGWMIWAVRSHAASRLASAVYAVTSALILSPMLWESTVRFHALSPSLAAAITVGFVILAIALSWQRNLQLIPWVATLTSVITAMALIIETHELLPLTLALLAVTLITEVVACMGHRLTLRAIPAMAADFAVWLVVFIIGSADTVPDGYHRIATGVIVLLCFLLLAIYGTSIAVRGFVLLRPMTAFEIAQASVAFGLATYGTMLATHGASAPALGVLFLASSAACYWGTLSRFAAEHARNRRVCAIWAAALMLSGSFLLFPAAFRMVFLSLAAVAAAFLYPRTQKVSLGLHASLYIAVAAAMSPLPAYAAASLAGIAPAAPNWRLYLLAGASGISYSVGSRILGDKSLRRMLWLVPAALLALTVVAVGVVTIARLATGPAAVEASTLSVIRTLVICAVALALAILGSHFSRIELGWLAYAAVIFGTLKLLVEDLRFGNAASLVVSLLFYGLILIFLPRLIRRSSTQS